MKFTPLAALGCLIILASCQQATSSGGSSTKHFTDQSTSGASYNYYSLSTGKAVTDPDTEAWDIAFGYDPQAVFTNSGDSATASGGSGGVYYSGKTDLSAVSSYDASKIGGSDEWSQDRSVAQDMVYGDTSSPTTYKSSTLVLNTITELYYQLGGTGESGDAYTAYLGTDGTSTAPWTQATSAYDSFDGSTTYSVTNRVYVVKSGDGTKYYKVQITSLTRDGSVRSRIVKYEKL
jgi:hypothetical protein